MVQGKALIPAVEILDLAGLDVGSAVFQRALAAALEKDQPLFLSPGTFRITRPLVIDYKIRADTGFRLMSMGAVINGKSIATEPVLEIVCSGGDPHSPKCCFYFNEQGTLFVNANTSGYAVVIGQRDFSDAHNSIIRITGPAGAPFDQAAAALSQALGLKLIVADFKSRHTACSQVLPRPHAIEGGPRPVFDPAVMQATSRIVPRISTTLAGSFPASWRKPSMFGETKVSSFPRCSRPRTARCGWGPRSRSESAAFPAALRFAINL